MNDEDTESTLIALYDCRSQHEIDYSYILMPGPLTGWENYLTNETTPDIRCVVWVTEESNPEHYAQLLSKESKQFKKSDVLTFINKCNNFIAAPDKQIMLDYLET